MSILIRRQRDPSQMREAMENGPVTPYYTLPLDKVYEVLNAALASEIICVLRYQAALLYDDVDSSGAAARALQRALAR